MNALVLAASIFAIGQCPNGQCPLPAYRPVAIVAPAARRVMVRYHYRPVFAVAPAARQVVRYRSVRVPRGRWLARLRGSGGPCR